MAGYLIGLVVPDDAEIYKTYSEQVTASVAQYDGEYMVRGGDCEVVEGEWPQKKMVIIRFPTVARAREWYHSPEYAGPKAIRQKTAMGDLVIVEGV